MGMLEINRDFRSPNFDAQLIVVEFAVIHYTAGSLRRTIDLFGDTKRQVSAHLVIDEDGTVYETVQCLEGGALKAWHAGRSRWVDSQRRGWEEFNNFSVGIEIVNHNGNLIRYREEQYASLIALLRALKNKYPSLASPERLIGHEQIAGYRGKSDPGIYFDWPRVFSGVYGSGDFPNYTPRLPLSIAPAFKAIAAHAPADADERDAFFSALSQAIECIAV